MGMFAVAVLVLQMPSNLQAQNVSHSGATIDKPVDMSPNPFRDKITLRLPDSDKNYKVQVFNNVGQLIYSEKMRGGLGTIVTQNWAPGHYLIKVNDMVAQKMILLD